MSLTFPKDVYPTDGVQFEFPITFPFSNASDVLAFLINDETGAFRRLVQNQDYRIDGTTLRTRVDDFRDPWPAGYMLTILRRTRFEQPSSQAMNPLVLRHRVDQLTQIYQQLKEQLDRTLHVGTAYPPLNITSKAYAIVKRDSIEAGRIGALDGWLNRFLDSVASGQITVTGGTLDVTLLPYTDWPVDEIEGLGITVTGGTMIAPITPYTFWPEDEMETLGITVTGGTMIAPLVFYNDWPVDEIQGTGITVTGGTLN